MYGLWVIMQTVQSDCSLMALHHELNSIALLQLVHGSSSAANIKKKVSSQNV